MQRTAKMRVAFLTNFSDSCFRSIPAVAQMADELAMQLVLIHAFDSKCKSKTDAQANLRSFFPEADRYASTLRICREGTVVDVVRDLHQETPFDLMIAPAANSLGLPRLGHRSMRQRLLSDLGVPVWTIGRRASKLGSATRNVAYWWNTFPDNNDCFPQAAEYAWRLNATLHVLCATPEVHEGSLGPLSDLIRPEELAEQVECRPTSVPVSTKVHLASGNGLRAIRELVKASNADVLIQPPRNGALSWLLPWRDVSHALPCPVIYMDSAAMKRPWAIHRANPTRAIARVLELAKGVSG